ncbi:hypothetical protein GCM10009859_12280 [Kocuria salsicia]
MSPLTRRQMLALGTAGAGAAAVGGAGLWWTSGGGGEALGGGRELVQPEVLSSRDGVLELALEAAPAQVRIGAREANVQAFNGSLPGPTLRVRGGDTIRVAMRNGLDAPTNLHAHGLHVSPEDNGDNPFVSIDPGTPSTTTSPFRRTTRPAPTGTTRTGTGTWPTSSRRVSTGPSSSRTPCPWPGTGCWWSPTSPSTTPGTWPRSPRRSG